MLVAVARQHVHVEDHELEELEALDRARDEAADPRPADRLDRVAGDGVDAHRGVGQEQRVEVGPRSPRDGVGVRRVQAADPDVIEVVRVGHPRTVARRRDGASRPIDRCSRGRPKFSEQGSSGGFQG